jgi:hypothetical protein
VKKIGRMRLQDSAGDSIGDIDVLVVDAARRKVTVVEAKCLSQARTPFETKRNLDALLTGSKNRRSTADLHSQRVEWVRANMEIVITEWIKRTVEDLSQWQVDGLMVLDKENLVYFLREFPFRVQSIAELKSELGISSDPD